MLSDDRYDIIIIGGGIIGVSAAYEVAKCGCRTLLLDREHFDRNASTGNSGIIALGHPPMPRPGMVRNAISMFFDPANPLYIPLRFDLDLFRWFWKFRKACRPNHFTHSMNVLAEMGHLSGDCFDRIVNDEQLDCAYHRTGWLEIFATERRFEEGRSDARMLQDYGYEAVELSREELLEQEPALKPHLLGAVHYPDSRFAHPQKTLAQLADRAAEHGATIRTGVEVQRIIVENGSAKGQAAGTPASTPAGRATGVVLDDESEVYGETIILAAGMWSVPLARSIGVDIPMQAGKGYHVEVTRPEPCVTRASVLSESYVALNPTCGPLQEHSDAGNGTSGRSAPNGLRIGGTLEFSGINERLVRKRLDMLTIEARKHLHGLDDVKVVSEWCGLRPCTADGLPIIGWSPQVDNLFIATGHAMMGFALGPATGRLARECVLGEQPSMSLDALSPERFVRLRRGRKTAGTSSRKRKSHQRETASANRS